jgi:hypothetical protein
MTKEETLRKFEENWNKFQEKVRQGVDGTITFEVGASEVAQIVNAINIILQKLSYLEMALGRTERLRLARICKDDYIKT